MPQTLVYGLPALERVFRSRLTSHTIRTWKRYPCEPFGLTIGSGFSIDSNPQEVQPAMRDKLLGWAARCALAVDRRRRLLVVTLHRVGPGGVSGISEQAVERLFRHLAKHYDLRLPAQLLDADYRRSSAVVTVDDSYADTYEVLFPIAKRHGVPFATCVPTDFFLRGKWLWWDKLKWAVEMAAAGSQAMVEGNRVIAGDAASEARMNQYLVYRRPQQRDAVIEEVLTKLHVELPVSPIREYQPVSHSDMRKMLSSGLVEITGHSVSHPVLTELLDEELEIEVTQTKRELEAFCNREVISFCYPNGDWNERTRMALDKAGYRIAFTTDMGVNRPHRMNLLALRRIHGFERLGLFHALEAGLGEFKHAAGIYRLILRGS